MRVVSLRNLTETSLVPAAAALIRAGASAQWVVVAGFAAGLAGAVAIATHHALAGLALIIIDWLLTGLAGAIMRLTKATEFGTFLGIAFEFIATAAVPFAFALADPGRALAAAFLLLSFLICGSASLAYGRLSAGRDFALQTPGPLSFFGWGGGREAVFLGFAVACLKQDWFSLVAYVLGALSFAAGGTWVAAAVKGFD